MNDTTRITAFSSLQLTEQFKERMEKIIAGEEFPDAISSGYRYLDNALGGFLKGNLYIIGARPAMGTTTFMVNLVHNMIIDDANSRKVVVFTPNLSAQLLMQRLVSCASNVCLEKISRGKVEEHEWKYINEVISKQLSSAPLIVDESPLLTISLLEEKCEKLVQDQKVDILFIDYLQLMTAEKRRYRDEEIATIMKGLKDIAARFSIPVVVLSQLSRAVEMRKHGSKIPQLSNLRDSGTIEQEADVVLFLYRPEYYDITTNESGESVFGETYIRIAKNRVGPLDTIRLKALLHIQKFIEYDEDLSETDFSKTDRKWTGYFEEQKQKNNPG